MDISWEAVIGLTNGLNLICIGHNYLTSCLNLSALERLAHPYHSSWLDKLVAWVQVPSHLEEGGGGCRSHLEGGEGGAGHTWRGGGGGCRSHLEGGGGGRGVHAQKTPFVGWLFRRFLLYYLRCVPLPSTRFVKIGDQTETSWWGCQHAITGWKPVLLYRLGHL